MTASTIAQLVTLAQSLPQFIKEEGELQNRLSDREDEIARAAEDREYTNAEEKELNDISEQSDRSVDNDRDLEDIKNAIEALTDPERGNPR